MGAVEVRRVGFRYGTDEELAAMHLVESEIEAERSPGSAAQPLEQYMSFARSLPPQFDDHTWLAMSDEGATLGCSACWSNAAGNPELMESYVYVRSEARSSGVGTQLARAVVEAAWNEGRPLLTWSSYDSIPAGDSFSQRLGGRIARVNRRSELRLQDLDEALLSSWMADERLQGLGYGLEFCDGPLPSELLPDAAQFHRIMNTAPRDELDEGDIILSADQVADIDRHLTESGRRRWTLFVRDRDGALVGGTEVTFDSWDPAVGFQQNTGIDPDHRGRGLAKWAKASMIARIREQRPEVRVIRTANAFSNDAMLAINIALGFEVVEVRTEWQAEVAQLRAALA